MKKIGPNRGKLECIFTKRNTSRGRPISEEGTVQVTGGVDQKKADTGTRKGEDIQSTPELKAAWDT